MIPGIVGVFSSPRFQLGFRTSGLSTGSTIAVPAAAKAGDIALLIQAAGNTTATIPTRVNPSGWVQGNTVGAGDFRGDYAMRILRVSDLGTTLTGMNGTDFNEKMIVIFSGFAKGSILDYSDASITDTGNISAQTVTASAGIGPVVVFGISHVRGGTAAFSTASPAFDDTIASANGDLLFGYKIYNSSPADHTIDMNDLGARNWLASAYLQVD